MESFEHLTNSLRITVSTLYHWLYACSTANPLPSLPPIIRGGGGDRRPAAMRVAPKVLVLVRDAAGYGAALADALRPTPGLTRSPL